MRNQFQRRDEIAREEEKKRKEEEEKELTEMAKREKEEEERKRKEKEENATFRPRTSGNLAPLVLEFLLQII